MSVSSVNVSTPSFIIQPGDLVEFTLNITTLISSPLALDSPLPQLTSGNLYSIVSQSPPGTFVLDNFGQQFINFANVIVPAGNLTITVQAQTDLSDFGDIYEYKATVNSESGPFTSNTVYVTVGTIYTLTKSSTSIDIPPGTPLNYTVTLQANASFTLLAFTDQLPTLAGGGLWSIQSQTVPDFYSIILDGPVQRLISNGVGSALGPDTYEVTIIAPTNITDAGEIYENNSTAEIFANDIILPLSSEITIASVQVCIHSSSKIKMADKTEKSIWQIENGDLILDGNNKSVLVQQKVPCWTLNFGLYSGKCVYFRKDSLAPNVPSMDFAIDAGHPMSAPFEYHLKGNSALKPAKHYVNHQNILLKSWSEIADLLPGLNERYDLVLSSDSVGTYIANNIVVRSRKNRKEPGYQYS